ncbi:MAG: hypothetical protein JNJ58_11135 [Chitinophagaceae bacterium]|nr:hypothetical protein [Chitinophagaceae bacterium]
MLLNDFFYIHELKASEHEVLAAVSINTEHRILDGHFPAQPVVPGVCMIEMLKEVLEKSLQVKLRLETSTMIKFLTLFAPPHHTSADFLIDYVRDENGKIAVNASLRHDEIIFLKFKGIYCPA